jgi:hypothetical protein
MAEIFEECISPWINFLWCLLLLFKLVIRGYVPQNTKEIATSTHTTITDGIETGSVAFSWAAQRPNTISSRTLMPVISTAIAAKS